MVMLMETLTWKTCYISMVVHELMGASRGFINSCRASLFSGNCSFEEHSNDKEFCMKRNTSGFVVVHAIHCSSLGDELLINYNFCRLPTIHEKFLALCLPLEVPLGHKRKMIELLYFLYFQWK